MKPRYSIKFTVLLMLVPALLALSLGMVDSITYSLGVIVGTAAALVLFVLDAMADREDRP